MPGLSKGKVKDLQIHVTPQQQNIKKPFHKYKTLEIEI